MTAGRNVERRNIMAHLYQHNWMPLSAPAATKYVSSILVFISTAVTLQWFDFTSKDSAFWTSDLTQILKAAKQEAVAKETLIFPLGKGVSPAIQWGHQTQRGFQIQSLCS
ncbi:Hypothetical predicted protein [Podarcis lilfordi]|uniref:Uncharacterized protein n=1 Tax=Podarcis lilfordi TaxID=74358 RepID=A0AA35JSJ2_9SAUR|nr:Hypothetical predicted protein [Podarcis lilfordi]